MRRLGGYKFTWRVRGVGTDVKDTRTRTRHLPLLGAYPRLDDTRTLGQRPPGLTESQGRQ